MVCPDCQVLIVNNIKTYDRVQHSQKSLAKYHSMLPLKVKSTERDSFLLDERDEEIEKDEETEQAEVSPTSKIRSAPKKRKLKVKSTFMVHEDIEFFHFEKKRMVPGKIISKLKSGKFSVLVAKSVPPQVLVINPIFINKIN